MMRILSRLMIAAGIFGTVVGTGATTAMAQGVYLQGPGFGVMLAAPHTGSATIGATPTITVRAFTRKGGITEVPTRPSVAGVTAIGISLAHDD